MDPSAEAGRKFGTEEPRAIYLIAREIRRDWKNVYFGAVPYLDAMLTLHDMNDGVGSDSAASIIRYFLANAKFWKGGVARHIKAELNAMLKTQEPKK
jgi:hypothetical protein